MAIHKNYCYVANAGDSRALLISKKVFGFLVLFICGFFFFLFSLFFLSFSLFLFFFMIIVLVFVVFLEEKRERKRKEII